MGFLDGYRVIDLTDHRGAMAGRILADLGADVVVVEPTGGSSERHSLGDHADPSAFARLVWTVHSHNKRSIVCDWRTQEGRQILEQLCDVADIVLVTGSPADLAADGLQFGSLGQSNRRLIHVTMSPYGLAGPRANFVDSDLAIWAASGTLGKNSFLGRRPIRIGAANQAYYHGAVDAVVGALLALAERADSGLGQHVDISFQQSLVIGNLYHGLFSLVNDLGGSTGNALSIFPNTWKTKDGYVQFPLTSGQASGHFTNRFFDWVRERGQLPSDLVLPDWSDMPQTSGSGLSPSGTPLSVDDANGFGEAAQKHLVAFLLEFFLTTETDQLLDAAVAKRLLLSPILSMAEIARNEHYRARGVFVPTKDPRAASPTVIGPFAVIRPDAFVNHGSIGDPGSSTAAVFKSWGDQAGRAPRRPVDEVERPRSKPLEGLKVADFSWVFAGPAIGRVLADYGATVVRVESGQRVDLARSLSPFVNGQVNLEDSAFAADVNAGKLSLALDLSTDAGRRIAAKLVDWADVVLESFTPGQMKKWGLDYETISRRRPDIIMLSTCLMGNDGPLASMAGFGSGGSALGGIHYVTGWPDKLPTGFAGPYTDMVAPRHSLIALLAALDRRRSTGKGSYIDVSQAVTGLHFMGPEYARYAADGFVTERNGNADPIIAPNDTYPCAANPSDGTSRYVSISIRSDDQWSILYSVLGLTGIDDLKQAGVRARFDAAARIYEAISVATLQHTATDVEALLQKTGIAAHVVLLGADLSRDPQLIEREHFIPLEHPRRGASYAESTRIRLSATPGKPTRLGPDLGEHEHQVLTELLGFAEDEVQSFRDGGALR